MIVNRDYIDEDEIKRLKKKERLAVISVWFFCLMGIGFWCFIFWLIMS